MNQLSKSQIKGATSLSGDELENVYRRVNQIIDAGNNFAASNGEWQQQLVDTIKKLERQLKNTPLSFQEMVLKSEADFISTNGDKAKTSLGEMVGDGLDGLKRMLDISQTITSPFRDVRDFVLTRLIQEYGKEQWFKALVAEILELSPDATRKAIARHKDKLHSPLLLLRGGVETECFFRKK
ncbi:hypothetical protein L2750_04755 [Shewanella submarina]|uniref:Uncharacterized protein n=1 Tax=Shewanella submarina TaxID=2016376 RepID=A0ABV7GJC5_9GAMM|nr:hypothetical protein [Shewanella submarina]MCL1036461.1 hypothetical protein [Shewanella submarina]